MPRVMLLGLLLASCPPRTAHAQVIESLELSGGYAFVSDPTIDLSFPIGWTASAAGKVTGWLSAVAEVSGSHRSIPTVIEDLRFSVHTAMLGARASARLGRFVEFGQVLAGIVRGSGTAFGVTTAATRFGAQAGIGLDYPLTERLAVRGQFDVRVITPRGGADIGREYRAVAGMAYRVF